MTKVKVQIAPGMYNWVDRNEAPPEGLPCVHLGRDTGETTPCVEGCRGVRLKVFDCAVFGVATIARRGQSAPGCCRGCARKESKVEYAWASAVTTVPSRVTDLLPRTLRSIAAAGFPRPWLYVDGCSAEQSCAYGAFDAAGCTFRSSPARVHGNWVLALYEMYIRNPLADRYVVFQDDVLLCRNARQYLDRGKWPEDGYMNLYTAQIENYYANTDGKGRRGWVPSTQRGKGALALCFTRETVIALLTSQHMARRPVPTDRSDVLAAQGGDWYRGQNAVDGGIVESLSRKLGIKEYIHLPTLAQHTGLVSSFSRITHPLAVEWMGEDHDALQFARS